MIPIHEQPYPLPNGWHWVYADKIFDIRYGNGLSIKDLTPTGYPVFGANGQIGFYKQYIYEEPQALMSCRGAYSGTMNKSLPFSYVTSNSLIITDVAKKMSADFICYLFSAIDKKILISGTAQPQVTIRAFKNFPIPMPPLDEQQRIVSLLDELFADLDEAKTLAQAVVDGSKLRRAAILHKAFTGELSQLWRDEHGTTLDSWQRTFWGKCGTFIAGSAFKKDFQGLQDYEIPFYKVSSLKFADDGGYLFDKSDTINEYICKELKAKLIPPNSLLFAKIGEAIRLNRRALNRGPCCIDNNMMAFIPEKILLRYAFHWSRSVNLYEYTNATTVPAIRKSDLEKIPVPLPPLEEQKEIVCLLDDLLGREQRTKDVALKTVERVELMKKSILARAFRGELSINQIIRGRTTH